MPACGIKTEPGMDPRARNDASVSAHVHMLGMHVMTGRSQAPVTGTLLMTRWPVLLSDSIAVGI